MQHINEKEEYTLAKIETLIKTLEQKQIITKKEAEAIPTKDLLDYTKSDLFYKLKQAKEIHKETPFYFDMPAKEIVKKEDIPFLAQSAYDDACRPGNPKETSVEDITKLYESLI